MKANFNYFNKATIIGVNVFNVVGAYLEVVGNFINYDVTNNHPLAFTNTNIDYTRNGITVKNPVLGVPLHCSISNNQITNTQNGISIINMDGFLCWENVLHYNIPYSNNGLLSLPVSNRLHSAINIQGCHHAYVRWNTIDRNHATANECNCSGSAEDPYMRGIQFYSSLNGNSISGNHIEFMSNGLFFLNSCVGTTIDCNYFRQSYSGVSIGKKNQNIIAEISAQTSGGHVQEDQWDNVNPPFVVDPKRRVTEINNNGNPVDWLCRAPAVLTNLYYADASFTAYVPAQTPALSVHPVLIPGIPAFTCPIPASDYSEQERADQFWNTVTHQNDYFDYKEEFKYYADVYAYCHFSEYPEHLTLGNDHDAVYQDYFNAMQQTNIATFHTVLSDISAGNLAEAAILVSSIVPANQIENNQKTCLLIYLATFAVDFELSNEQRDELLKIASQLSVEGGEGVFWARAMLDMEVEEYPVNEGGRILATQVNSNPVLVPVVENMYPNPAADKLTIELINGDAMLTINDVNGKIVVSQQLNNGSNEISTRALNNGVYYYRIFSGGAVIKSDKLILIN